MPVDEAQAGTLTNETPEMLPAIMPKATIGHGAERAAR